MADEKATTEVDNHFLGRLKHLTYPYEHKNIQYRTYTLPDRMTKTDTETLLVKCKKGVMSNGVGFYEYCVGQIQATSDGFKAIDIVNSELGVFASRWAAREKLVELAEAIFPEWFDYRTDPSADW